MIEIRQQVAVGTKAAIPMYKVYRWNGEKREYLGWCGRGANAKFNPYREYTDTDKKLILRAVNDYMQANGYPPLKRYGQHGLTVDQIEELKQRAGLTRAPQVEDDDDE